jgi:predicted nucleic acid-binding protein
MKGIRVYVDTSVFGGIYDVEFDTPSQTFFDQVKSGRFSLVISAVVQNEIENAPQQVKDFFDDMLSHAEITDISEEAIELQNAYLQNNIVSAKYADDALHVAVATVAGCSLIVSWNFKHIVHFQKIPLYNAVNIIHGYQQLTIVSPLEVIHDEDEEDV